MLRIFKSMKPPTVKKADNPLRFGILGAARIAPDALLTPAKSHADVVVAAVACRDKSRGDGYAKTHDIAKVYSGSTCYQDLLDDPQIDAVYIPLPNGLHFEWTMRAIIAGKHVLVEKPMTNTSEEARQLFAKAEEKGVVVLEAVHFTFHPATKRVKEIVESGELGRVKSAKAGFAIPTVMSPFFFLKDDIRFNYELGGGCSMDMGVYPVAAIQYLTGTDNSVPEVTNVKAIGLEPDPTRVERSMFATYVLSSPQSSSDAPTGETFIDFGMPGRGPFGLIPHLPKLSAVISLEGGEIEYYNYFLPVLYHYITVRPRNGKARTEKAYTFKSGPGEAWWSTYRYQLEAFVDKIRGRNPRYWPAPETTISKLECIERTYEKAGMPPRPKSSYQSTV